MREQKMNNEVKIFNLNECVTMRLCYDRTEAPMAIKRSVRPFIKAISASLKEASDKYNEVAKEYLGGKDPKSLTDDERKSLSDHMNINIFKINSEIYPAIDLARPSTLNFFVRFWTPFSFKQEDGEYNLRLADEVDDKIVDLYPELEMDLDKEEELKVADESANETVADQEVNTDSLKQEEELQAAKENNN